MTSQCNICGRDKVSDYQECYHVENDYQEVLQIENMGVKRAIVSAFKAVQAIRCQFMHWLIQTGIAVPDGEMYKLPEGLSLRPEAMLKLEQEIIMRGILVGEKASSTYGPVKDLNETIAQYVHRSTAYFEGHYENFKAQITAPAEAEA